MDRTPASALALALALAVACIQSESYRTALLPGLEAQLERDRDRLAREAETSDPARADLEVTLLRQTIMDIRPTNNLERPYVAHVRIRWRFDHADGRPAGETDWDYVYAFDRSNRWVKADDTLPEATPAREERPGNPVASPVPTPRPA